MSTQRDSMNIRFADGTKGLIITEISTGKLYLTAEYEDVLVYYCGDHVGKNWIITRGADKTNIGETATRKEAIAQIILDVRKNQVRTARTYILTTVSGREFEVVATSEQLAKKAVRFKYKVQIEELHTKEIKNVADARKQNKAKIGEYADIINEILPTPSDEPKTEEEEEYENEHFVKQMSEPETESQIKDECLIDGVNFMILWTSEIMFHVYMNDKCVGHGEICRSKIGFMYECEEYNGFIKCNVENLEMKMRRVKIMDCMIEYYNERW